MPGFITTAEIRWFIEGSIPNEIFNLFGNEVMQFPERNDYYLIFPESSRISLKLREGRLEIKSLIREGEDYQFSKTGVGKIGIWEKWGNSLQIQDPESFFSSNGVEILKKRSLTGLTMKGEKIFQVIPDRAFYETEYGCTVELSSVMIYKRTFWSVNLECWDLTASPDIRLTEFLDYFFKFMLNDISEIRHFFHTGNALSYPQFLREF